MKMYLIFSTTLLSVAICRSDRSSNPNCDFSESYKKHRIGKGWNGITKSKCEALGNCYDDNTPNIKWCFLPTERNTNNRVTTSLPIVTTKEAVTEYFQAPESTSEFLSDTTVETTTSAATTTDLTPTEPILIINEAVTEYFEIPESKSKTSSEATVATKPSNSTNLKTIEPLSVNESMTVKNFVTIVIVVISLLCSGLVLYFVYNSKSKNRSNQPPKCSFKNTIDPTVSIDVNHKSAP